nr:MAG TPA: hypothetical protein [Bacteriophage sp.]
MFGLFQSSSSNGPMVVVSIVSAGSTSSPVYSSY